MESFSKMTSFSLENEYHVLVKISSIELNSFKTDMTRIYIFSPTLLINSIKHVLSCKVSHLLSYRAQTLIISCNDLHVWYIRLLKFVWEIFACILLILNKHAHIMWYTRDIKYTWFQISVHILHTYFMPVCSIVKLLPRCAVDNLMHFCTRPKVECNSASGRARYRGLIVWLYYKKALNSRFNTQPIWRNTEQRSLNGVAIDDAVLLQNRKFHQICSILVSKCSALSY